MGTPLQSILKNRNFDQQKSQGFGSKPNVRFDIQGGKDSFNIAEIIQNYTNGQDETKYLKLLQLKNDPDMNDSVLRLILGQLEKSTYLLGPKVEKFVDAILHISWCGRSPDVVKAYQNFLLSLVSSNPFYCKPVIKMGARIFQTICGPGSGAEHVHQVIQGIVRLVPLSRNIILEVLGDSFPYIGSERSQQVNFTRNLLDLVQYFENSRPAVLALLCNRLLKLDVNTPRDLIRQSENSRVLSTEQNKGDMALESAALMDEIMFLLFSYIKKQCERGWDETRALYRDLTNVFETLFLPAADLHHAPFVIFFICSFKASLYEVFIDKLWGIFENPSSAYVIRKSAMDYTGSFLARAAFVPLTVVLNCLQKFCKWIHRYISSQSGIGGDLHLKVHGHLPFYFVCGAVFEIIAARWTEFAGNKKFLGLLEGLNLPRIVSCNLNPLRYCHPEVVKQFSNAGSYLQLVMCETIIAENRRQFVPETNDVFVISGDPQFPFDCYLLKKSSVFIEALLRRPEEKKPETTPAVPDVKVVDEDNDFFMDDFEKESSLVNSAFRDDLMYN